MLLARRGFLLQVCLLVFGLDCSLGLRFIDDESITPEPSVVITGIGDSGTSAVTIALNQVGMEQCGIRDEWEEPYWGHDGRANYIRAFLEVTHGEFTREAFNRSSDKFLDSQNWFKNIAGQDYKCILDQRKSVGLPVDNDTADTKWGFKEPHYAWLLPSMDEAFHNRTKYLLIARDPRDICTNDLQDQFHLYGPLLDTHNCYEWWAVFWTRLLEAYEDNPRFGIVRIEDLVLPDPDNSTQSLRTMGCMVKHVGMKASFANVKKAVKTMRADKEFDSMLRLFRVGRNADVVRDLQAHHRDRKPQRVGREQAEQEVRKFHNHTGAYQGHHNNFTEDRRLSIVSEVKNMTSPTIVHQTMRRLGYDPMDFNILKPTSRACLCHPA